MRVLIAALVACCLILLALARAGHFPAVDAEPSVVQIAQKKGKGGGCFDKCVSKGRSPTACNQLCG